jgi:hypothetical protein
LQNDILGERNEKTNGHPDGCQKKAKVEETPAPVDTTVVVDTVKA